MRFVPSSSFALFLLIAACGDSAPSPASNSGATGGLAGSSTGATATATTGGSVTGTGSTTGGGATTAGGGPTSTGAGGAGTGSSSTTTTTTTGGAAGFDNGGLFGPDSSVPISAGGGTGDGGVAPEAAPGDGSGRPPGDGNVAISHITGTVTGTAEFTQKGVDVTVVINLTLCPNGIHSIRIHDGFSCDNAGTMGNVWDGKRGDGIGGAASTITCAATKGMLTYTRPGNDPTANWTVADHNLPTDVTSHVVIVSDGTTRIACGNFF